VLGNLSKRNFHAAPFQHAAIPDPVSTLMPQLAKRHYAIFWGMLIVGFACLIGLTDVTVTLHTRQMEEIFIIAGSLFVPVLFVYYLDMRSLFVPPRFRTLLGTFLMGVVLAAPLAIILESILPSGTGSPGPSLLTGLIEEFCKAGALFWLMFRGHRYLRFEMDGIILGAAAGMGFAAIEDMIYGAAAFHHGIHQVVFTVWLRQLLGPFGHGVWTAIVGGAIWRAKGAGGPRITLGVLAAYLTAAVLHGLWDWAPAPGLYDLLWLLGVGVAGILVLRAMIHQSLDQEKEVIAGKDLQISPSGPSPGPAPG
jgi:RsiW-degrading membrane proteinase PrsW (M82 family)